MSRNRDRKNLSDTPSDDWVYTAAAEWIVRLQDAGVSEEDILAWQAWMREAPSHAHAFRRMEELGGLLRELPRPVSPTPQAQARDGYDGSTPISLWERRSNRLWPRWAVAAAVLGATIALTVLMAIGVARMSTDRRVMVASTRIGENRPVRLDDGSIVTLGGNSKIAVRFSARERFIDLLRGEAYFEVMRDSRRPLKVVAGRAAIIDVGTEFDVQRTNDSVIVDVVEGRVVVQPHSPIVPLLVLRMFRPQLAPVTVIAGEQTIVAQTEIEPPSAMSDPEEAASWRSGLLVFRMRPLGELLQEVNRYSKKPIVVSDPSVAAVKVTGTVVRGHVSEWATSLNGALGIVAIEEPDRIVLYRSK